MQRALHDEVLARLRTAMQARSFGDRAMEPGRMGPQVSAAARQALHDMVQRAVADGATLECGGTLPDGKGFFYPPTLLSGLRQDAEVVQQETFGPVLCVLPYDDFDDALAMASDHQYGLASVLYSNDYREVMQAGNEIQLVDADRSARCWSVMKSRKLGRREEVGMVRAPAQGTMTVGRSAMNG